MKVLVIFTISLMLSLFQTSFFGGLVGASFAPNLILAFGFSLMFKDLKELSLMSVFIGGLMLDLLGFNIVGISSLVMVGSLFLFYMARRYISKGWLINILGFTFGHALYDLVLGNLLGIGFKKYLIFIVVMFGFLIMFYLVLESVINYLLRVGIKLEE